MYRPIEDEHETCSMYVYLSLNKVWKCINPAMMAIFVLHFSLPFIELIYLKNVGYVHYLQTERKTVYILISWLLRSQLVWI